jgi:cytosine/adenosine deaminase-related metal-dependent hydrolase|tara:strand:- start:454 stop:1452 length:999 start_codon:yes stop_codon:yes gene_type:complete
MFDPNKILINKIKEKGGFINAHAHFDRAFTVTEANMEEVVHYHLFNKWKFIDSFKRNALSQDYLRNIVSAIRAQIDYGVSGALTFVDVDTVCGFKALEAVQEAKRLYKDSFNLKVCSQALKGVIKPKENELLRKALEMDYLDAIGGLPRADAGYEQAHLDEILYLGKTYNKRIHVHVDQLNNDLEKETELLARRTMHWGLEGKVTAVHGISIACHPKDYRQEVYKMSRDAGLSFISCPTAWIDSRRSEWLTPTHNAITPVEEMIAHGLVVAIGSDNIHDVYKPYSTGEMALELKFLLESLHMYDAETLINIATKNGRLVIGMEEFDVGEGEA